MYLHQAVSTHTTVVMEMVGIIWGHVDCATGIQPASCHIVQWTICQMLWTPCIIPVVWLEVSTKYWPMFESTVLVNIEQSFLWQSITVFHSPPGPFCVAEASHSQSLGNKNAMLASPVTHAGSRVSPCHWACCSLPCTTNCPCLACHYIIQQFLSSWLRSLYCRLGLVNVTRLGKISHKNEQLFPSQRFHTNYCFPLKNFEGWCWIVPFLFLSQRVKYIF